MDNRETLTPSSGDAILKRHLFSEVARNWIKGRGHIERAYFVRRPSRQSFGFRVAASSGPIPKAPGSAGGYLPSAKSSGNEPVLDSPVRQGGKLWARSSRQQVSCSASASSWLMPSTRIGRADGYGPFHFAECRSQPRLAGGFD